MTKDGGNGDGKAGANHDRGQDEDSAAAPSSDDSDQRTTSTGMAEAHPVLPSSYSSPGAVAGGGVPDCASQESELKAVGARIRRQDRKAPPTPSAGSSPPATQPGAVAVSGSAGARGGAESDTVDEDTSEKRDRGTKRREPRMQMRPSEETKSGDASAEKEEEILEGMWEGGGESVSGESPKLATVADIPISTGDDEQHESERQTNATDLVPAEDEGFSSAVPMIQAELVAPPIEAYRVSIDEDPANTTSAFAMSPLELEHTQRKGEDRPGCCGLVGKRRWIIGVVLGIIIFCAVIIPLVVLGGNQSDKDGDIMPTHAPTYPYPCYTSTLDILQVQIDAEAMPEVFIICPNTLIEIGTFRDPATNDFHFVDGDYPITAIRENVVIQCGLDGKRENECVFDHGFIQVLTLQTIPLPDGEYSFNNSIDNFTLRGLTFTGKPENAGPFQGNSVTLSHPGTNIRFEDCLWSNFSAQSGLISVGRNYFQELVDLPLEELSIDVTFSGCVFENIIYDHPLIMTSDQNVTIDRSVFRSIELSALLHRECKANSEDVTINFDSGCAILFYCGAGAFCAMDSVCVIDFEYKGNAIVVTTDSSRLEYNNMFLDMAESEACQLTVLAFEDFVFSNCTEMFTAPFCPVT